MVALGLNKRIRGGRIEHVLQIYEKTISVSSIFGTNCKSTQRDITKKYKL